MNLQRQIEELEDEYKVKLKDLNHQYDTLNDIEREVSIECDDTYDRMTNLKVNKGFSEISNNRVTRILEEFSDETKASCTKAKEQILENIDELKLSYTQIKHELEEGEN